MSNPSGYTVGWICAISTERVAARAFLDEEHDMPDFVSHNDNNVYTLGRVWKHNVVIAALPDGEYGTSAAASVARDMLHSFPNVRIGLMVGIGGGVPTRHDIRLGDVVVSAPHNGQGGIFQYDFGKTIQAQEFQNTGFLDQPPTLLRSAVSDLKARYESDGHQLQEAINSILDKTPRLRKKYQRPHTSTDRLYLSNAIHPLASGESCAITCGDLVLVPRERRTEDEDDPAIHYGLIASGNQLMKDALIRDQLASKNDVLCFEMEAAGLMNHFPCLVIRGICDYSDSHKSKDWQGYAAMTAAAYAKDVLRRISPNKIEAEKRIADTVTGVKISVDRLVFAQQDEEKTAILNWITPVDYGTQQSDNLRRRQQGTGEWLLNSEEFQTWVNSKDDSRMLFCPGMPGAGKTVLTSIVVDHLHSRFQEDSHTGIAYFYFNYMRQDEQTIDDLLASLLKQLAEPQHSLPAAVKDLYDQHKSKRTRPSVEEFTLALQSVVMLYSRVFIMIDALDECTLSNNTRSNTLSGIFTLRSEIRTNFFITSRLNAEIGERFQSIPTLEIRASDEDVHGFLRGNMLYLPRFVHNDPGLQNNIITSILKAVQGMFLLAQFHLDSLKGKTKPKEITVALRKLATGSDAYQQIYTDTMQRIVTQYKEHAQLAKSVLIWVTFANRPITVAELQHALGVEPGESAFDEQNMPDIELMVSVCAGLVTIDNDSRIVRLVHYTTQEFFQQAHKQWLSKPQSTIATICVTYLSYNVFEDGTDETRNALPAFVKSYPLYDYASRFWGDHARRGRVLDEVVRFLEDAAKIKSHHEILGQLRTTGLIGYSKLLEQTTGLHLATWFGLVNAVDQLTADNHCIEAYNGDYETSLLLAAGRDDEAIVRLLLDKGANTEATNSNGETSLLIAVSHCNEAIVQLLLDKGAKTEARALGRTSLHVAVGCGHVAIVQLLLAKGANTEATNGIGETPLLIAVSCNHKAIVRLFLNKDTNTEATNSLGETSLLVAVSRNHKTIARLLLNKAANIEARVHVSGETPLFIAATYGYKRIARLLLNKKAKIQATDVHKKTPLHAAAGNVSMVRLLLNNGANIDAADKHGQTALFEAVKKKNITVIEILLKRGADINAVDYVGRTPLLEAAQSGYIEIFELLKNSGANVEIVDSSAQNIAVHGDGECTVELLMVDI